MAQQLDDIVKLQETLSELETAEAQISGIPEWMRDLHDEYSQHRTEIDRLESQAEEARKERRQAEAAISDLQEQLKRYQQQINQVSTQREYGALLAEIDAVKTQITTAEESGLGAMESREEAEQKLESERGAFKDLEQRYNSELARWESEKPGIASRIEVLTKDAAELRGRISKGVLRQFERIREKHDGEGLASILEMDRGKRGRFWHCGACNYRVRPQALVEVRAGELRQCEGCKRMLYVPAGGGDEEE